MLNRWPDKVSDDVFNLLERWIEEYTSRTIPSSNLPLYNCRYVYEKFYNKLDQACYRVKVMEGPELMCQPTGVRDFHTRIKDFTIAIRSVSYVNQLLIASYLDPFNVYSDKEVLNEFLSSLNIRKNNYIAQTGSAFVLLQRELAKRGLVRSILNDEIRTWKNIAERIGRSIPTAMQYAINEINPLPVFLDGPVTYTREKLIRKWQNEKDKISQYRKIKKYSRK